MAAWLQGFPAQPLPVTHTPRARARGHAHAHTHTLTPPPPLPQAHLADECHRLGLVSTQPLHLVGICVHQADIPFPLLVGDAQGGLRGWCEGESYSLNAANLAYYGLEWGRAGHEAVCATPGVGGVDRGGGK